MIKYLKYCDLSLNKDYKVSLDYNKQGIVRLYEKDNEKFIELICPNSKGIDKIIRFDKEDKDIFDSLKLELLEPVYYIISLGDPNYKDEILIRYNSIKDAYEDYIIFTKDIEHFYKYVILNKFENDTLIELKRWESNYNK